MESSSVLKGVPARFRWPTVPLSFARASNSQGRFGVMRLFLGAFLATATLLRAALLVATWPEVNADATLLAVFGVGLLWDIATALLAGLPLAALLLLAPKRAFSGRLGRGVAAALAFAVVSGLVFSAVAEWTFWAEFGARFNFIAVDYLIYTTEVLDNITQSYPVPWILGGTALLGALAVVWFARGGALGNWSAASAMPWRKRVAASLVWVGPAALVGLASLYLRPVEFANQYHEELAKNGVWSLFSAFWDNELDYDQFYTNVAPQVGFATLRRELAISESRAAEPLGTSGALVPHDTLRRIASPIAARPLNVVQITVESLSADFLGTFGSPQGLTPNLDALVPQSLLFENFYATGTRTDRGMEALALGLPPTPGRSLIKRPRNRGLFTLGGVLRERGYDTAFLYGGFGYFDNMNAFFSGNGYRVVDRASAAPSDISFANAWGACDGDLYRWTLREADRVHESGKPFHFFLMTTSNHRPYTYPEGCIDLPPKVSGRNGAVKYTDYAIGEFLAEAQSKPWYRDTIFVIVADHCASSAGKTELPAYRYHVPLMIFSPGGQVSAGRYEGLCSQIDFAPTLLGLLGGSYESRFFGVDLLRDPAPQRALIGTYQLLGLLEPKLLTVLSPQRRVSAYDVDWEARIQRGSTPDPTSTLRAISYYSTASWMYAHDAYSKVPEAGTSAVARREATR
ncbi:MAG: sulfatase-like hydrolase/transferase [Planctomycetaceae bacterium]|nr:sulfatase-like hydrolase/transferase [Planctomycetaceae bacterium]